MLQLVLVTDVRAEEDVLIFFTEPCGDVQSRVLCAFARAFGAHAFLYFSFTDYLSPWSCPMTNGNVMCAQI